MSIKKLQALKAKKGFTLVELIVVIAIIAILAAILIPLLVNHVANSRCSGALADAKQGHALASEDYVSAISDGVAAATAGPAAATKGSTLEGVTVTYNSTTEGFTSVKGAGSQQHTYDGFKATGCTDRGTKCPVNKSPATPTT